MLGPVPELEVCPDLLVQLKSAPGLLVSSGQSDCSKSHINTAEIIDMNIYTGKKISLQGYPVNPFN